jgi:putative transposase
VGLERVSGPAGAHTGFVGEPRLIRQAYRFALDPSVEQEGLLRSFVGVSRFWFNAGLAHVKDRLDARERGEDVRVPWSYHQLCSEFKGEAIKNELAPWRSEVVTGSYQAGLEMLGRALQNFSDGRKTGRRVGFPRFRAKGRCRESVIFQRPRIKSGRLSSSTAASDHPYEGADEQAAAAARG